jgi:hypothetical protein
VKEEAPNASMSNNSNNNNDTAATFIADGAKSNNATNTSISSDSSHKDSTLVLECSSSEHVSFHIMRLI